MLTADDDLSSFEANGAAPLPAAKVQGYVERDGARVWYSTYGSGPPVIMLHGGLGHSGNWGYQVPALLDSSYQVVLIDSRGHGRSTRDARPYSYELMAADVQAVMDATHFDRAAFAGWSDGACTALMLAMSAPARVAGVFYFGCNMDPSGAKEVIDETPALARCFHRHSVDYAQLSATPDQFTEFVAAVGQMQRTQPNVSAQQLATIRVPVVIVHSERDEFIKREHEYLAHSIPGAELLLLPEVSHFAPLQRPRQFNAELISFLDRVQPVHPQFEGVRLDRNN